VGFSHTWACHRLGENLTHLFLILAHHKWSIYYYYLMVLTVASFDRCLNQLDLMLINY
jgi:hypothetical protein